LQSRQTGQDEQTEKEGVSVMVYQMSGDFEKNDNCKKADLL